MFWNKRIKQLECRCNALEQEVKTLRDSVKDLKTLTVRTSQDELPVSSSQILDEWLNGAKEDEENG